MLQYRTNKWAIILFLLPTLLVYSLFEVVPIVQTFYFSLYDWNGIQGVRMKFVGLANFTDLFAYKGFDIAMKNVARYIVLSLLTQIPIGFAMAIVLYRFNKGFRFFKAAFFSPLVLSYTAVGLMWYFIFYPNDGVLNRFLEAIGLSSWTRNWLIDPDTALNSVIFVTTWASVGIYMTLAYAAITAIPEPVLEAGMLDGATGWKRVRYLILPMIFETTKISVILVITGILKTFEIIFVLTEGGPNGLTNVPVSLMYYEAFKYDNYGLGSAIGIVVFVLSILLTVISLRMMRSEKLEY